MPGLKYTVIKKNKQYRQYCRQLESLLEKPGQSKAVKDEVELLTLLIEKWEATHSYFNDKDPIQILHSLMTDHQLQAKDLVEYLGISKGYVSDILSYKKGLSKTVIRKLAERFKISQEAFNRPYQLLVVPGSRHENPSNLKTGKAKQKVSDR